MSDTVFREVAIDALCARVTSGGTPLRSRRDFYDGGTVDWFKTGELNDWYLDSSAERITTVALEKTSAKLFPANTVLVAMYGDGRTITTLGMLRRPAATNQACAALIANPTKCEPRFLFYALKFRRHHLIGLALGGAQRNLSAKTIKQFMLPAPQLATQRRIASILSAYDDLIENCQRRIRILEDLARGLFREWFVHFRFPGADSLPRVDSPLGPIPQGWQVKLLNDCVEVNPRVVVPREGEKPFVPMGCLANDSMLITDVESRTGNSGAKFANGDTLFARITPCLENGKTGFVQFLGADHPVAFGSTEFIVLRSRTVTPEFVYLLARSDDFRANAIKSMSGASGRQRVQERCFDAYRLVEPTQQVLERFSAVVRPMFQQVQRLHHKITNLRRTRDLLLPRLMSGQIDLRATEAMPA